LKKSDKKKHNGLLTNPTGNTLFNKLLRILDNSTPDLELTEHLAKVLKHIVETDFSSLFEDHNYKVTVLSDCITSYDKRKIDEMLNYYKKNGSKIINLNDLLDKK